MRIRTYSATIQANYNFYDYTTLGKMDLLYFSVYWMKMFGISSFFFYQCSSVLHMFQLKYQLYKTHKTYYFLIFLMTSVSFNHASTSRLELYNESKLCFFIILQWNNRLLEIKYLFSSVDVFTENSLWYKNSRRLNYQ